MINFEQKETADWRKNNLFKVLVWALYYRMHNRARPIEDINPALQNVFDSIKGGVDMHKIIFAIVKAV